MTFLGLDLEALGITCALGLIAGLLSGLSGFGAGLVLTAYLTPILGVKTAVPVLAVAMLVTNFGRLWAYRREFDRRTGALVLAGALPMSVVGSALFSLSPAGAMEILLGSFLIAAVPLRRWLSRQRWKLGAKGVFAGGAGFGLATGTTPGTGVLLISLLLSAGLSGPALIGTDAAVAIATNLAKAIAFGRFALLDSGGIALGGIVGASTVPGSFLAAALVRRTRASLHVMLLEALVIVGGAQLIYRAAL